MKIALFLESPNDIFAFYSGSKLMFLSFSFLDDMPARVSTGAAAAGPTLPQTPLSPPHAIKPKMRFLLPPLSLSFSSVCLYVMYRSDEKRTEKTVRSSPPFKRRAARRISVHDTSSPSYDTKERCLALYCTRTHTYGI